MKIKISDIPEEGLNLQGKEDPASLGLSRQDLKFISPIEVSAFVKRDKDDIYVHLATNGKLELICGRCLLPCELDFKKEFDLNYEVGGKTVIDLTDNIRQEIILDYPLKMVCREDCKGLCQVCGKNLNEGECGHKTDSQRWDELNREKGKFL